MTESHSLDELSCSVDSPDSLAERLYAFDFSDSLGEQLCATNLSNSFDELLDSVILADTSSPTTSASSPCRRSSSANAQDKLRIRDQLNEQGEQGQRAYAESQPFDSSAKNRYSFWETIFGRWKFHFESVYSEDEQLRLNWQEWMEDWNKWLNSSSSYSPSFSSSSLSSPSSSVSSSTSHLSSCYSIASSPVEGEAQIRRHLNEIAHLAGPLAAHARQVASIMELLRSTVVSLSGSDADDSGTGNSDICTERLLLQNCEAFDMNLRRLRDELEPLRAELFRRRAACATLLPVARHAAELLARRPRSQ